MDTAMVHKPLGQWLLDERVLDHGTLQDALTEQRVMGGRLGDRLIASGRVRSRDVFRCLALQHNLPFVSLTAVPPDREALKMLPEADARTLGVVPVRVQYAGDGLRLTVAVGSPEGRRLAAAVERRTGARVEVTVADPAEIQEAFKSYRRLGGALGFPVMRADREDVPAPVDVYGAANDEPDFIGDAPSRSETRIRQLVDADLDGLEEDTSAAAGPMVLTDDDVAALEEAVDDVVEELDGGADGPELGLAPPPPPAPLPLNLQRAVTQPTLLQMGQAHFDPPDVVALRARVMKLETQVSELRTALDQAQEVNNRVNILEALVEQLLRARQTAAAAEPAMTPPLVTAALESEALPTPPDGVAVEHRGAPASWEDAGAVLEARQGPPPLPLSQDSSGNSTDEVLALLDEEGPATLDAVVPESDVVEADDADAPPPLPRRKGNPFAALLAEAEAHGVRNTPPPEEPDAGLAGMAG